MNTICESIERILTEGKHSFHSDGQGNIVLTSRITSGYVRLHVIANEEQRRISVIGSTGFRVPDRCMGMVLVQLNRFNAKSSFATAYLDPEDGELMASYGILVDDMPVSDDSVLFSLQVVLNALSELHMPVLQTAVSWGICDSPEQDFPAESVDEDEL